MQPTRIIVATTAIAVSEAVNKNANASMLFSINFLILIFSGLRCPAPFPLPPLIFPFQSFTVSCRLLRLPPSPLPKLLPLKLPSFVPRFIVSDRFWCFPCRHPYNTSNSERNVKNVNFDVFFVIFDVDSIILRVNKAAAR